MSSPHVDLSVAGLVADLRRRVAELERKEAAAGIDPLGHDHSKLVASDGDPAALEADATGNLTQADGLYIATDEIRARNEDGLKLYEDGGTLGVFVGNSGNVVMGGTTEVGHLTIHHSNYGIVVMGWGGYTQRHTGNDWGAIRFQSAAGAGYAQIGFQTTPYIRIDPALYITGNCSAASFTDRSPVHVGDALAILKQIKPQPTAQGDWLEVDHDTLPERLLTVTKEDRWFDKKSDKMMDGDFRIPPGQEKKYEEREYVEKGRDIGANIQLNSRAICQLAARLDALEKPRKKPK